MENSIVELLEKTNYLLNGIGVGVGVTLLFVMVAVMLAILIIKK